MIHHQQTHARWPDRQENFRNTNQAEIDVRYELMPIAQQDDGAWKIRLVLHRLEQLTCRDGERKQTHLARADHPTGGVDPYEVMKMSFKDYAKYRSSDESTNPPPPPPHFAEDLLAEPLLLKLAPDGVLQSFEDRPEFEQIAPGVKFKECLALVLPVLPGEELRPATAWTRTVPVDLPARPLNHGEVAPMALRLNYRVETIETVAGRRCARIRVNGHFAQDDLAIPIHQEVYRYLVWTKSVVRIEDELEGEFLFDLENHSMRRSSLRSVYQYSTISGRKEDRSGSGRVPAGRSPLRETRPKPGKPRRSARQNRDKPAQKRPG